MLMNRTKSTRSRGQHREPSRARATVSLSRSSGDVYSVPPMKARRPDGQIASRQLSFQLARHYTMPILARLHCDYSPESYGAWPGLMLRVGTTAPFAPIKHILLAAFLCTERRASAARCYARPGPRPFDAASQDSRCVDRLRQQIVRPAHEQRRSTIRDLMTGIGAWQVFRHDRAQFPSTSALLEEFKRSNLSARQTGGRNRSN